MKATIIDSNNYKKTNWSGGTTTELFIFPHESNYKDRNFDFRLSSAAVLDEKSNFTSFEGFSRKLMILDGEIKIKHKNHPSKSLKKFDIDEFDGSWETTSFGKCTDFNLIANPKIISEMSSKIIEENKSVKFEIDKNWNWVFIYLYSGNIDIEINNTKLNLEHANLLLLQDLTTSNISFTAKKHSELIFVYLKLN